MPVAHSPRRPRQLVDASTSAERLSTSAEPTSAPLPRRPGRQARELARSRQASSQTLPVGQNRSVVGSSPTPTPAPSNVLPMRRGGSRRPVTRAQNMHIRSLLSNALSTIVARQEFANKVGFTYGKNRRLISALGRSESITVDDYEHRYRRGGIAGALVDKLVNTALRSGADIIEGDGTVGRGVKSTWETQVDTLFDRLDAWQVLREAFIECRKCEFSIIVIGAKVAGNAIPANLLETPLTSVPGGVDGISYLKPFGQAKIQTPFSKEDLIQDETHPLVGHPKYYTVKIVGDTRRRIHYSRIIHIADSISPWGSPVMERVWDLLDDLDKIVGGGAEGTFQNIKRRARKRDPLEGDEADEIGDGDIEYDEEAQKVEDAIAAWAHGLIDDLVLDGIEPQDIKVQVPQIASNAKLVMRQIAAARGYPERVLFGTEEGKLAGEQDSSAYADDVKGYREGFCERHVRKLIDKFMAINALPTVPQYTLSWAVADKLTPESKASTAAKYAAANRAQKQATGEIIITADEIRRDTLGLGELEQPTGDNSNDDSNNNGDSNNNDTTTDASNLRAGALSDDAPAEVVRLDDVINAHERSLTTLINKSIKSARNASDDDVDTIATAFGETLADGLDEILLDTLNDMAAVELSAAEDNGTFLRDASESPHSHRSLQIEIDFDTANPRAVDWAAAHAADTITDLTDDAIRGLNQVISTATDLGYTTTQTAQLIGSNIGLSSHEISYVTNLATNMANAAEGTTVRYGTRKVVVDGTRRQLDRTVNSYIDHLLTVRKKRLARSLLARAANEGLHELWRQALESGALPDNVVRVYIKNTERHADRDGDTVAIGESFPIEPGADANCGCTSGLQRG